MLHLGNAFQALGNLMKAAFAAVQLQTRLLAGFVEEILANGFARVVRNVAATSLGLLAFLQTEKEFRFVARPTELTKIAFRTRQGTARAAYGILSKTTASTTYPVLVPLEFYKNSDDSILGDNIIKLRYDDGRLPFNVEFTQDQKSTCKKIRTSRMREDNRNKGDSYKESEMPQSTDRQRVPRNRFS